MAIIWPESLPQKVLIKAYDESMPKTVIRTPMAAGPSKSRRIISKNSRFVAIELIVTKTQVGTFDDFLMDDLKNGVLSFEWKHPRTNGTVDCRIMVDENEGPKYRALSSNLFNINFILEILP